MALGRKGPVVPSTVPTDRPRAQPGSRWAWMSTGVTVARSLLSRCTGWLRAQSPEGRDAFLYGCSAVFAGVAAVAMGIPLYRQWGELAVGPYLAAAILMTVVARRAVRSRPSAMPVRRWGAARVVALLIVLFGATVVPLGLEVVWASEGNASLHVQPEVLVVERAGVRAAHGQDPYQVVDRDGHILIHQKDVPVYELYYPYLPGMVIFGFSSVSRTEARLTDARIQFLVFTAAVTLLALSRLKPSSDARDRAFQVLTVLPPAALPLATGGDDMPVAALMLLGLVALQRRRPLLAGLALGAASSLKFTAWPLVLLAVFGARDLAGRRRIGWYAVGVAAVMGPVVLPVALHNPSAFVDNVIRFPLGLAGVSSPAASALPGHILVAIFPGVHRAYVVAVGVVGGAVLLRYLFRSPPHDAADVARFTGWVMLVAILLAPATRVGYLLYPINLFVWVWLFRRSETPSVGGTMDRVGADWVLPTAQLSSGISNSSTEYGVTPAEVVGETTTPTSQ